MSHAPRPSIRRFIDRIRIDPGGCWEWVGARFGSGYGALQTEVGKYAHRFAFHYFRDEPLVDGLVLMHSCDNRWCVNPWHLSQGTPADNVADMVSKGRQKNAPNSPARQVA